jgi:Tim17/Tim22/Tim23/Pmp24 family
MEHQIIKMGSQDPTKSPPHIEDDVAVLQGQPSKTIFNPNERLSLAPPARIAIGIFGGLLGGMALGFMSGFQTAGLRFRAENAHRMPKSEKDWFFYHRSKSHYSVLAGMKASAKTGAVLALMTGIYLSLEEQFDHIRGGQSKDCVSSIMAGTMSGALYSLASTYERQLHHDFI